MAKLFESIGKLGLALAIGGGIVNSALYNGKLLKISLLLSSVFLNVNHKKEYRRVRMLVND